MSVHYACERCGHANTAYGWRDYSTPKPDSCWRCGAVHSILGSEATVISPVNAPLDAAPTNARRSPWMLPWTRPVLLGLYECRFSDLEPHMIVLRWDGHRWRAADDRPVSDRTFLSWRGWWQ
jgi:hypothetical protein